MQSRSHLKTVSIHTIVERRHKSEKINDVDVEILSTVIFCGLMLEKWSAALIFCFGRYNYETKKKQWGITHYAIDDHRSIAVTTSGNDPTCRLCFVNGTFFLLRTVCLRVASIHERNRPIDRPGQSRFDTSIWILFVCTRILRCMRWIYVVNICDSFVRRIHRSDLAFGLGVSTSYWL